MSDKSILVVLPYGFNDRLTNFVEYTVSRLLAKNGWRVIGLTRKEAGEPTWHIVSGIEVFRFGNTLTGIVRACMLFATRRPDIVHVHTLRNNRIGIATAMLAKLFRVPLAFSEAGLLHDHYLVDDRDDPLGKPIHYQRVARTFSLRRIRDYLFHWPLTHADSVVFFSTHNVSIAQKLGITRVHYIPHIIDESHWGHGGSDAIETQAPTGTFGLFVGQMKLRKGWDVLMQAIPFVPRDVLKKFVFITSSSKTETADFSALADSLGIRDRVVFLGRVPGTTLRMIYEKSSLVVVPSRYEGFGLVPLEGFEARKPVVASRVDALTDYLVHEKNAYLVEPKNPEALARGIGQVMRDEALCARLIAGGEKTLAQMRSHEYAELWLSFYKNLIALRKS